MCYDFDFRAILFIFFKLNWAFVPGLVQGCSLRLACTKWRQRAWIAEDILSRCCCPRQPSSTSARPPPAARLAESKEEMEKYSSESPCQTFARRSGAKCSFCNCTKMVSTLAHACRHFSRGGHLHLSSVTNKLLFWQVDRQLTVTLKLWFEEAPTEVIFGHNVAHHEPEKQRAVWGQETRRGAVIVQ